MFVGDMQNHATWAWISYTARRNRFLGERAALEERQAEQAEPNEDNRVDSQDRQVVPPAQTSEPQRLPTPVVSSLRRVPRLSQAWRYPFYKTGRTSSQSRFVKRARMSVEGPHSIMREALNL